MEKRCKSDRLTQSLESTGFIVYQRNLIKKTSENPALSQWNFHSFFICIGCCYLLNFMLLFRDEDHSGSALEFLKENKVLVVLIEKIVGSLELRFIRLLGL